MRRIVGIYCLIFSFVLVAKAQQAPLIALQKRGELVLSIDETYLRQLPGIDSWSVDRIRNGKAEVYVNLAQYQTLLELNIPFIPLKAPSLLLEHTMAASIGEMALWNAYPTYQTYLDLMQKFADDYPALCTPDTIGYSVNGRLLLALKISDNPDINEAEPKVFYTSSMHGDELTGYVLMLRLIDYLLKNYSNERIKNLVDQLEIYINPLANPDGAYKTGNHTVDGATRTNANGVDINRNFPAPSAGLQQDMYSGRQTETLAMMEYMQKRNFSLSMNHHGGAEVLNYPWDDTSRISDTRLRHPDNDWFNLICREFVDTIHGMDPYYMTDFNNGVTIGWEWYRITGGRQDYVTYFLHGREVTSELSTVKIPDAATLAAYWEKTYRSFLNYLNQALYGIQGMVTDTLGNPLQAKITLAGHDADNSEVYSQTNGAFYRYLKAGNYLLQVSAEGYQTREISLQINDFEAMPLNVVLEPLTGIEQQQTAAFKLFPNPATNYLTISYPLATNNQTANLKIYNTLGSLLHSQSVESPETHIDVSDYPSGIYFISLSQPGIKPDIQKFIVE
ncbi:MAG: M14 family zinc carboxypeptidase [Salinivirgaceae bacterium]